MKYPKTIITEEPYGCKRTGELCDTFKYVFNQPEYVVNGEILSPEMPMYNNSCGYTLGLVTLIKVHKGKPCCIDELINYEV